MTFPEACKRAQATTSIFDLKRAVNVIAVFEKNYTEAETDILVDIIDKKKDEHISKFPENLQKKLKNKIGNLL